MRGTQFAGPLCAYESSVIIFPQHKIEYGGDSDPFAREHPTLGSGHFLIRKCAIDDNLAASALVVELGQRGTDFAEWQHAINDWVDLSRGDQTEEDVHVASPVAPCAL